MSLLDALRAALRRKPRKAVRPILPMDYTDAGRLARLRAENPFGREPRR